MSSSLLQRGPRMPTLSLAQRLAAGFGAMVILLVAVTAVSMWELRTMGAHLARIVDENNPKSELANRLLNDLYEMSIQARSIALLTDAADIEGEVRRMEASRARYALTEKALQARIGVATALPEERQLIEDIVAQGRKVLPLLRQAAQEGQDGANIQATETLTKVVRPLETVWQAKVAQLVLLEAARNRQADEAARAGLSHAMAMAMAMVGVAALVGALLGWRIVRHVKRPIDQAIVVAERIAAGDLSSPVEVESNDEIGRLLQAIGCMQDSLRELVTEIRQSAESIQTASAEVSAGSLNLQQRTEATASNLRSTAGSMDKLTGAVRLTAESAVTANELATTATTVAQRGGEAVSQVVSKMADMTANSRRIADIVGVIDLIAFQTNVLALNAAVEAAQAGDAGRGFAVVAGEVRALAKRSADAAKEIKGLIDASVNGIATVSNLVQHAGGTMADIVVSAGRVTEVVAEISTASIEQSRSMAQLSVAAATLDEMTQHNAALVEQSTASAEMLRDQAVRLMALVMSFKVRREEVGAIVP